MQYLPLFLDLRDRLCAVVGGDATAARKAELLLRAGARVRMLTHEMDGSLADWEARGRLTRDGAALSPASFGGCAMAVIAVDSEMLAKHAAQLAQAHGIPVNVVDRPALCTCIMPAIVDRSPVLVAISTAGAAPVLGRLLRARLEALLPARLGRLASLARELRPEVTGALPAEDRRRFWESILQGDIAEMVFDTREEQAVALMRERLACATPRASGEIYVVRSPPGNDPERITLRGVRLLQQCDVVFHDSSLPSPVLDLIRRDAHRRGVGPDLDAQTMIDDMLSLARTGQRVAWLGRWKRCESGGEDAGNADLTRRLERTGVHCLEAD